MAKHQAERETFILMGARLASMNLFNPSAYEKDKDPEYFVRVLLDKGSAEEKQVVDAVRSLYERAWPADAKVAYKKAKAANRILLHDGDEQADKDGFDETVVYMNASTKEEPTIVGRDRKRVKEQNNVFYPGCYVNLKVQLYTWENVKGRGVGCDFLGIQFSKDGDALETSGGGATAAPEDVPLIEEEGEAGSDWAEGDAEEDDDSWN